MSSNRRYGQEIPVSQLALKLNYTVCSATGAARIGGLSDPLRR